MVQNIIKIWHLITVVDPLRHPNRTYHVAASSLPSVCNPPKSFVAPLTDPLQIPAALNRDQPIFHWDSMADTLPKPELAANSRAKSKYRSEPSEINASAVPPKKRKIVDENGNVRKNFRTTFRIINTAEFHVQRDVQSLREQVKALKQQKRRLEERLAQKSEKLEKYEQVAADKKRNQSMVEELFKRRANKEVMAMFLLNQVITFYRCICSYDKNVCSYLTRQKI